MTKKIMQSNTLFLDSQYEKIKRNYISAFNWRIVITIIIIIILTFDIAT